MLSNFQHFKYENYKNLETKFKTVNFSLFLKKNF